MAKVVISESLKDEIFKKFKNKSLEIFSLMKSLGSYPNKGKVLGNIGGILIKEIKYEKFGFYFITDGHMLRFGTEDELANLLIRFVRMSEKKDQQKVIEDIKRIIMTLGESGF